ATSELHSRSDRVGALRRASRKDPWPDTPGWMAGGTTLEPCRLRVLRPTQRPVARLLPQRAEGVGVGMLRDGSSGCWMDGQMRPHAPTHAPRRGGCCMQRAHRNARRAHAPRGLLSISPPTYCVAWVG